MNEIKNIKLTDLVSAPNNPFKITMDAEMERLIESISETGVIAPIIVRPTDNGKYEIVSGHRRKYACEYLGIESVPAIIKELNRNEAVIFLVDSNLQRENILPSEKAFAYKMKLEAIKHQGKATCGQVVHKSRDDITNEESGRQIQRYIRLTNLITPILDMVDEGKIAMRPAVELSYLPKEQQQVLFDTMELEDCTPSHAQAIKMRKFAEAGKLNEDVILSIMTEEKPNQVEQFKIPKKRIDKYFSPGTTPKQMEDTIIKALELYRRRERGRER